MLHAHRLVPRQLAIAFGIYRWRQRGGVKLEPGSKARMAAALRARISLTERSGAKAAGKDYRDRLSYTEYSGTKDDPLPWPSTAPSKGVSKGTLRPAESTVGPLRGWGARFNVGSRKAPPSSKEEGRPWDRPRGESDDQVPYDLPYSPSRSTDSPASRASRMSERSRHLKEWSDTQHVQSVHI